MLLVRIAQIFILPILFKPICQNGVKASQKNPSGSASMRSSKFLLKFQKELFLKLTLIGLNM